MGSRGHASHPSIQTWLLGVVLLCTACDADRQQDAAHVDRTQVAPPSVPPSPQAAPDSGTSEEPLAPRPTEHPVVFAYRAALWARLGSQTRSELDLVDTTGTQAAPRAALEYQLADRVIRTIVPAAFEGVGEPLGAALLRRLAPVTNRATCDTAMDAITTASGASLSRARAASSSGEPPVALAAAVRAAGHAGNACRVVAGLERVGADEATGACDDTPALLQSRACRSAALASPAAARAAASLGGAMDAAAAAATAQHGDPVAARAGIFRSSLELLRDVVTTARRPASGRHR